MAVLARIGPGSAFKVGLVVYGFVGFILGVVCFLMALAGTSFARQAHLPFAGAAVGIVALILCPILYGILGGIIAVISAVIYNLAAGWVGGLEVEIK
jgi:uncharacterized membrane protein YkvI